MAVAGIVHYFDAEGDLQDDDSELGFAIRFGDGDGDDKGEPSPELRALAEKIALDERYDGGFRSAIIDELTDEAGLELSESAEDSLRYDVYRIFERGVGKSLNKTARRIVRDLVKHPEFDPLFLEPAAIEHSDFVQEAVAGEDPRVLAMVAQGLRQAVWNGGLREIAERELNELATSLIPQIPMAVRDQVAFTSRNAVRDALLSPYLDSVAPRRRPLLGYWIKKIDGSQSWREREVRYAATAQNLLAMGVTKTAIATRLQLSSGVLNRLLGTRVPDDFTFDPNDHLITDLAPELQNSTKGS